MAEEIRQHLEMRAERNLAAGMSEDEAQRTARRSFGGVDQVKERARDQRTWVWLEQWIREIRFAIRQLVKSPGFTAIAIATLAVGIGACTTIFSIAYGMLFRPLAYPHPEQLVRVFENRMPESRYLSVAPATYLQWKEKATDFQSLAIAADSSYNVSGPVEPFRANAQTSTANFFSTLGVQPMLGRNFRPDEDKAGKSHVLILSRRIWKSHFDGNPRVIGQTVLLDKVPYTIIGVISASYVTLRYDIYTPVTLTAKSSSDYKRNYRAYGRLKPGVSVVRAITQLQTIDHRLAAAYPGVYHGIGATVMPLNSAKNGRAGTILFLLLGAVGCLLLIACTNIANLLLARSSSRQAEIAVRAALGAGRRQIVRQLLVESLLLAVIGGTLGILAGHWGLDFLKTFLRGNKPIASQIRIDGGVVAFTGLLTALTGIGFGLVPALQASRIDLTTALKDSGWRGTLGSKGTQRLRSSLVIAQVALALILLSGAGLFYRSILKAEKNDVGYETKTTYLTPILFSAQKYATPQQRLALINQLIEKATGIHGIVAAAFTNHTSPVSMGPWAHFEIVGRASEPDNLPLLIYYGVTRGYFKTLQIPLIRGRLFNDRDTLGAPRVALINQAMAQTVFAHTDPIGQMIVLRNDKTDVPRMVVGVVGNTQLGGNMGPIRPQLYEPYEQVPGISTTFLLRTNGTPLDLKVLNAAFHSVDPDVPDFTMSNLGDRLDHDLRDYQIIGGLFGFFSIAALFLASMGIYGVMAFDVSQRTGEIGLRMALGACGADVMRLVLRRSSRLIVIGLVAGLAGALGFAQLLRSQLYDTSPYDPLTFVIITLVLATVALLATWLPARRATRVDPIEALRTE